MRRVELLSSNPTELGGFKEVIFMVEGKAAYSQLKYEVVHRVNGFPKPNAGGRIHTSAACGSSAGSGRDRTGA